MRTFVIAIVSTKGGQTKSTNAANIGAFCAEHGLKTLLIDTDVQPTLTSYYELDYSAPGGLYELLINKITDPVRIISKTVVQNLDLIQSNDAGGIINQMLRNAPDGALRFRHLLSQIPGYDVIVIDTRGTRDITVDMSVLASDVLFCPILPHILSAKEFIRGTVGMYQELQTFTNFGLTLPPIKAVASCVDNTNDAKFVLKQLHDLFEKSFESETTTLMDFTIPSRVAYREAATYSLPVYKHSKVEYDVIKTICSVLMPQFAHKFEQ